MIACFDLYLRMKAKEILEAIKKVGIFFRIKEREASDIYILLYN